HAARARGARGGGMRLGAGPLPPLTGRAPPWVRKPRQCNPPVMAGRSRPNRALTASAPCPGGTASAAGALGAACACVPKLAAGDRSNGPFAAGGATLPLGGMRVWDGAGGTEGTSRGGRSVNELSGPCGLPKNCAPAAAGNNAGQKPVAQTRGAPPRGDGPPQPLNPRL